jgi:hypothetical protein
MRSFFVYYQCNSVHKEIVINGFCVITIPDGMEPIDAANEIYSLTAKHITENPLSATQGARPETTSIKSVYEYRKNQDESLPSLPQ